MEGRKKIKKMRANEDVRAAAKKAEVPLWMVANHVGISEPTLTRWLRVDLTAEKRDLIMAAIKTLSNNVSEGV